MRYDYVLQYSRSKICNGFINKGLHHKNHKAYQQNLRRILRMPNGREFIVCLTHRIEDQRWRFVLAVDIHKNCVSRKDWRGTLEKIAVNKTG